MRSLSRTLLLSMLMMLGAPLAAQAADARVIVKYRAGAEVLRKQAQSAPALLAARAQVLSQRSGLGLRSGHAVSDRSQVVFASGVSAEALAARLAQDPDVEYAVPDRRKHRTAVPNDPLYAPSPLPANGPASGQWYLKAPGTTLRSAIDAVDAWDLTTSTKRASVVVAVLDTGIRKDHRDLAGNLLPGYDMISDVDIANDGDGRDDDPSDPGDWITVQESNAVGGPFQGCAIDTVNGDSSSWHGTEVSGLIAAITDNRIGMASVGRDVKVLPVRVLGKCGGFDSDIQAGMRWAAGIAVPGLPTNPNPAKVINLSLGGSSGCANGYPDAVADVLAQGASVVVSTGNGYGSDLAEPAGCPGVIAVGAVTHDGLKADYSNLGEGTTISAPGGDSGSGLGGCAYPLLSTRNSGATTPVADAAGGSVYSDSVGCTTLGTSFSAPLVSGTVALMLSVTPDLTPAEVRSLLRSSARAFPSVAGLPACQAPDGTEQDECNCSTATCGAGMLDARAAVAAAAAPPSTGGGGGGGGGALAGGWLLLLLLAVVAVRRPSC